MILLYNGQKTLFTHYSCTVHALFIGPMTLFTHLKIILLQCFQFSVFSFSNSKFNPNGPQVSFFLIFKTNLNFLLEREHIHKANLVKLIFVQCLSCVFNISFNIMHKRVYGSLEPRRPNSIWAKWVPNTFLFCNLAPKLRIFE